MVIVLVLVHGGLQNLPNEAVQSRRKERAALDVTAKVLAPQRHNHKPRCFALSAPARPDSTAPDWYFCRSLSGRSHERPPRLLHQQVLTSHFLLLCGGCQGRRVRRLLPQVGSRSQDDWNHSIAFFWGLPGRRSIAHSTTSIVVVGLCCAISAGEGRYGIVLCYFGEGRYGFSCYTSTGAQEKLLIGCTDY